MKKHLAVPLCLLMAALLVTPYRGANAQDSSNAPKGFNWAKARANVEASYREARQEGSRYFSLLIAKKIQQQPSELFIYSDSMPQDELTEKLGKGMKIRPGPDYKALLEGKVVSQRVVAGGDYAFTDIDLGPKTVTSQVYAPSIVWKSLQESFMKDGKSNALTSGDSYTFPKSGERVRLVCQLGANLEVATVFRPCLEEKAYLALKTNYVTAKAMLALMDGSYYSAFALEYAKYIHAMMQGPEGVKCLLQQERGDDETPCAVEPFPEDYAFLLLNNQPYIQAAPDFSPELGRYNFLVKEPLNEKEMKLFTQELKREVKKYFSGNKTDLRADIERVIGFTSASIDQLQAEYKENEYAANQKYQNARILVSAKIDKIGVDKFRPDGPPVVILKTKGNFLGWNARLNKQASGFAVKLKADQEIRLLCEGIDLDIFKPTLKECEIYTQTESGISDAILQHAISDLRTGNDSWFSRLALDCRVRASSIPDKSHCYEDIASKRCEADFDKMFALPNWEDLVSRSVSEWYASTLVFPPSK